MGFVPEVIDRYSPWERACPPARSLAIDQVSRLWRCQCDYRRIALSKEEFSASDQTSNARLLGKSWMAAGPDSPLAVECVVAFLCSEEGRWVNAQRLKASGRNVSLSKRRAIASSVAVECSAKIAISRKVVALSLQTVGNAEASGKSHATQCQKMSGRRGDASFIDGPLFFILLYLW